MVPLTPLAALAANAKSDIIFKMLSNGTVVDDGFKITKYRIWHVAGGYEVSYTKGDTPADPTTGVYDHNLGSSTSSPPWERIYTDDPNAKLRRVCFSGFQVEHFYDYVEIRDGNDNIIQVLTGNLGTLCSAWVHGSTIKVQLYSDSTVSDAGFTITSVEVLRSTSVNARYPGQWYDKDTEVKDSSGNLLYAGLHYNWHRYYDANVGRYITPDPLGLEAGANLYGYTAGDPINFTDPDGLAVVRTAILIGLMVWTAWEGLNQLAKSNKATNKVRLPTKNKKGTAFRKLRPREHEAFRHCFSSCSLSKKYGKPLAKIGGIIFESIEMMSGQSLKRFRHGLYNNSIGCRVSSGKDCVEECKKALLDFRLRQVYAPPEPSPKEPVMNLFNSPKY